MNEGSEEKEADEKSVNGCVNGRMSRVGGEKKCSIGENDRIAK